MDSHQPAERLFPEGHALHRLQRPTFSSIRRVMRGMFVATLWVDADIDPARAGFRPSYDSLYGPGASLVMPFVAAWLSTGTPRAGDEEANVALFPAGIDASLLAYATEVGLLGRYELVESAAALMARVRSDPARRRLYNIDDLGPDFDESSMVSSELSRWLNSKEQLGSVSAYAPVERVKDMSEVTLADYQWAKAQGAGRVFLKTCNTESAGMGVYIANSEPEFHAQLAAIIDKRERFGLNRSLVIQPELAGKNKSFQVLLDPRDKGAVSVVALSDQIVEADGKTYRSSVNHPIDAEHVEPVGAAILDMVDRVWARHPEAFGFLMSDYFATDRGPVIFDPGIRPTGNTATALAAHLARALTGSFFATSLVPFPTGRPGFTFGDFARLAGELVLPGSLSSRGRAVMPWGWNPIQGFGMLIAIAKDEAGLERTRQEIASVLR